MYENEKCYSKLNKWDREKTNTFILPHIQSQNSNLWFGVYNLQY